MKISIRCKPLIILGSSRLMAPPQVNISTSNDNSIKIYGYNLSIGITSANDTYDGRYGL
ncbi:hypothetical protein Glove_297g26 [Diversispora epigaea]|uniref:Uncharacterized protein n=1 Tax=Diversispora epigaea TaxID=1348612 RepID=A0A397HYJ5_9GLOM|nr:hypothetical protein Glove_297g26 [Diversispora epigaea]